ncbi:MULTISPECIES: hypothetical protein [unclassified Luteimonas]
MSEITIISLATSLLILLGIVICFAKRRWLRVMALTAIYALFTGTVMFGMGATRMLAQKAIAEGRSQDYVSGIASRDTQLRPARLIAQLFGTGLFLFGLRGLAGASSVNYDGRGKIASSSPSAKSGDSEE